MSCTRRALFRSSTLAVVLILASHLTACGLVEPDIDEDPEVEVRGTVRVDPAAGTGGQPLGGARLKLIQGASLVSSERTLAQAISGADGSFVLRYSCRLCQPYWEVAREGYGLSRIDHLGAGSETEVLVLMWPIR